MCYDTGERNDHLQDHCLAIHTNGLLSLYDFVLVCLIGFTRLGDGVLYFVVRDSGTF